MSPTVYGFRLHHYMYGLAFIILAFFTSSLTLYGIGLGLFVDQLPLFTKRKWHWDDYDSIQCRLAVLLIIVVVYEFRNYMLHLIK